MIPPMPLVMQGVNTAEGRLCLCKDRGYTGTPYFPLSVTVNLEML